jgi:predicted DNA-binding protein (MmcQ/YjbR family)
MGTHGGLSVTVKGAPGAQHALVRFDPERFFPPPYQPHQGWIGVRLDLQASPNWSLLAALVEDSYRLIAPKRLAALLGDGDSKVSEAPVS